MESEFNTNALVTRMKNHWEVTTQQRLNWKWFYNEVKFFVLVKVQWELFWQWNTPSWNVNLWWGTIFINMYTQCEVRFVLSYNKSVLQNLNVRSRRYDKHTTEKQKRLKKFVYLGYFSELKFRVMKQMKNLQTFSMSKETVNSSFIFKTSFRGRRTWNFSVLASLW